MLLRNLFVHLLPSSTSPCFFNSSPLSRGLNWCGIPCLYFPFHSHHLIHLGWIENRYWYYGLVYTSHFIQIYVSCFVFILSCTERLNSVSSSCLKGPWPSCIRWTAMTDDDTPCISVTKEFILNTWEINNRDMLGW